MKFIVRILCCILLFSSCFSRNEIKTFPPYKLITEFAEKLKPETGLALSSYGINITLPKDYPRKGIGNFQATFKLIKTKNDEISLEHARNLIVFLGEKFLQEINSNSEIRSELDFYPFISDSIDITVCFVDKNDIDLGQGVSGIYFREGKIVYKGYKIHEYSNQYPAVGKHFTIHKETYTAALEIVNAGKSKE